MKSSRLRDVVLFDKKLNRVEIKYGGQSLSWRKEMRRSLMTDGNADFTSRKSAATNLFSRHFLLIQDVRKRLASLVQRPARPPKWPGARMFWVSAQ